MVHNFADQLMIALFKVNIWLFSSSQMPDGHDKHQSSAPENEFTPGLLSKMNLFKVAYLPFYGYSH